MRIGKMSSRPENPSAKGTKGPASSVPGTDEKSFDSFLNDNRYKAMEEELTFIMEDIKNQGQKLADKMNLESLMQYKKSISKFLDKAVNGMLEFKKDGYFDRGGRHNVYALVRKVDNKLEELTKEVLDSQKDQLAILDYIDDIRGLLMDITL